MRVTVAIPTFRRPDQLAALLAALPERIAETPDAEIDVLVIDNAPEGSARATVEAAPAGVRYVHETTPGISAARNRALDESRSADLLAFLDDDEIPLAGWLSSLVEVWRGHRSAAVAGRVISVFHEDTDPWIIASGTFRRPQRATGTSLRTAAAGNLLLDIRQVQALGLRFDGSLGLSGGEDTLFTRQLVERGGTIVWCNESAAEDHVVPSRLTRDWAVQRAFSAGNGWANVNLLLAQPTRRPQLRGQFSWAGAHARRGPARYRYGRPRDISSTMRGEPPDRGRNARRCPRAPLPGVRSNRPAGTVSHDAVAAAPGTGPAMGLSSILRRQVLHRARLRRAFPPTAARARADVPGRAERPAGRPRP